MNKPSIILNLHGIGEPRRTLELGEAPYWITRERFREIVDLAGMLPNEVRCSFTIDDGNLSDATIAGPYLAEKGFAAEIFVLTGRIGTPGSLDQAALTDLAGMGHTIGSHGRHHRDWRRLNAADRTDEISGARVTLQELTGKPIEAAAIPFGAYNRTVLREVHKAGFHRCYSSDGGYAREGDWPMPRLSVRCDHDMVAIEAAILMREPRLAMLKRRAKREVKKRL